MLHSDDAPGPLRPLSQETMHTRGGSAVVSSSHTRDNHTTSLGSSLGMDTRAAKNEF